MAVATTAYARFRPTKNALVPFEWVAHAVSTGDGSGGTITQSIYLARALSLTTEPMIKRHRLIILSCHLTTDDTNAPLTGSIIVPYTDTDLGVAATQAIVLVNSGATTYASGGVYSGQPLYNYNVMVDCGILGDTAPIIYNYFSVNTNTKIYQSLIRGICTIPEIKPPYF